MLTKDVLSICVNVCGGGAEGFSLSQDHHPVKSNSHGKTEHSSRGYLQFHS